MSKPLFASRTAFDALQVEYDDDSEEEQEQEQEQHQNDSEPVKLTKTAIKKAAKAAREAKKQQRLANKSRDVSPSPPTHSLPEPVDDSQPLALNGSSHVDELSSPEVDSTPQLPDSTPDVPDSTSEAPDSKPEPPSISEALTDSKPVQALLNSKPIEALSNCKPVESTFKPVDAPKHLNAPIIQDLSPAPDTERAKKRQNVVTRTVWTLIMIFGFIGLLLMGHAYMIILVMLCQMLVYREVTALFSLTAKSGEENKKDPWSKTLNWYFFAVTNYFLYGESIIYYFKHVVFADAQLHLFATNHRIVSFSLYTIGFMGFVMSLKKGYLKQQFGLFCWVHMTLLLIVVSSHFIMNNILEGLIWFFVPASLVICNDVFAYIWGQILGRTPLISLSPKKTVEGFVGAFFTTVLFSVVWGSFFMRYKYMICPVHDLGVSAWDNVQCEPNPVFVWREWEIWRPVVDLLGLSIRSIPYVPYHFHLGVMATFASLVAPFGGFFASGFKRAFDIKDFGHSIPGHGGMTDRMDCQFLMGVFVYVYHSSLIREHHVSVGSVLQIIVSGLSLEEQVELVGDVRRYLEGQGVVVPC